MGKIYSIGLHGLLVAGQSTRGRGWGGFHTVRYFHNTEFIEDGKTIGLVPIDVVAEDDREYHAVSTKFNESKAGSWVRANVLNQLPNPSSPLWENQDTVREELLVFFTEPGADSSELWAWIGAYDHIALARLRGDMVKLSRLMPRYTREPKQYWEVAGKPRLPKQTAGKYDTLADAQHNLLKFQKIEQRLPLD